jgi:hypothetical protein
MVLPIFDFDDMIDDDERRAPNNEAHHESPCPQYPSSRRAFENRGGAKSTIEQALLAVPPMSIFFFLYKVT